MRVQVRRLWPDWDSPFTTTTGNSTYSQQVNDAGYLANAYGEAHAYGYKYGLPTDLY